MKLTNTILAISLLAISATSAPAGPSPAGDRAAQSLPYVDIRSPSPRSGNKSPLPAPRIENRANTSVNPDAVTGTTCIDPNVQLVTHDTNVAILSICGGIAGAIQFCEGDPTFTVGASGTSKFTLDPVVPGATINVSKGRWEGCVRAAQAVCPTGTYTSTCIGGVSEGEGFVFTLSANE